MVFIASLTLLSWKWGMGKAFIQTQCDPPRRPYHNYALAHAQSPQTGEKWCLDGGWCYNHPQLGGKLGLGVYGAIWCIFVWSPDNSRPKVSFWLCNDGQRESFSPLQGVFLITFIFRKKWTCQKNLAWIGIITSQLFLCQLVLTKYIRQYSSDWILSQVYVLPS